MALILLLIIKVNIKKYENMNKQKKRPKKKMIIEIAKVFSM